MKLTKVSKRIWRMDKDVNDFKIKDIFTQNTDEFCRNTTLHGIKYVADNKLKPIERCFFGVSIGTVICLAIYLILRAFEKWSSNPVIFGINPEPTIITNEPFPAVTICNLNQASDPKVSKFSKNSPEYEMLQLLCKRGVNRTVVQTITDWGNLSSFIYNISQSCEDMLIDCRFGGQEHNCTYMFYPLVTDEGFCCVFNMLHPKFMYVSRNPITFRNLPIYIVHKPVNWHAEMGYPKKLPKYFYPGKVPGIGESLGLSITLDVQKDKYYCSSSSSVGFKIDLHNPNESPNIRETGVYIEPGKETKLRIKPDKTETAYRLRSIPKKYRHCLFHSEGNLKFFAHYTQRNCEMECIAEISHHYCGCVSYFMPKMHDNFTVCSINDRQCEKKIRLRMDTRIKSCLDDCLPSCFELNFQLESFSTKLSNNGFDVINPNIVNMSNMYVEENIAIVHMYFKEHSFRSNIQTEFIGISDILSSIGGLMGLFLGFSFMSIVEFFYFAIIRPCRSICQNQKSKNVYQHLEIVPNRRSISLSRVKQLRKLLKNRYKSIFPSTKANDNENYLFKRTTPDHLTIADNFNKRLENNMIYWLE